MKTIFAEDESCSDDINEFWEGTDTTDAEMEALEQVAHAKIQISLSDEEVLKQDRIIELLVKIDNKLRKILDLQEMKSVGAKMTRPKIKGIKNLIITKESFDEIWDEGDDTL